MTADQAQHRRHLLAELGLVGAVILLASFLLQTGVFTVDESHYLLATKSFLADQSFHIDNGYELYQRPELLYFYTVFPDKLETLGAVATVPPYHAIFASLFLWLFGFSGLFWLNILSFAATIMAVRRLASAVKPDGFFPLLCAGMFALASYGLEYALGIWPHSLSQALISWAAVALLSAREPSGQRTWILAGLAGLLGGLAVGIRLQNILLLPIFLLASRFAWHRSWSTLAIHFAGWIPPLLGLSWINQHRLGTANPFTYGASLTGFAPFQILSWIAGHLWVLVPALLAMWMCWWLWRTKRLRILWGGAMVGMVAVLLLLPWTRSLTGHWLAMAGFHLLDTIFLPAGSVAMGAKTNQLGQVFYGGVLKKGLLEVAPFLALTLLSFGARWLRIDLPRNLIFLFAASMLGLALLPFVLSTGGLCYNPRYLLEWLPVLTVVSFFFAAQLRPSPWLLLGGSSAGFLLALPTLLDAGRVDQLSGTFLPTFAPLLMALLLVVSAFWALSKRKRLLKIAKPVAAGLFGATLAYSIFIQWGVDLDRSRTVRYYSARILNEGKPVVADNSVLITWKSRQDIFSPLKLSRDVFIAGVDESSRNVPAFIEKAIGRRRVFLLRNDIPDDRFEDWTRSYRRLEQKRHGLIFVELLPVKKAGPGP